MFFGVYIKILMKKCSFNKHAWRVFFHDTFVIGAKDGLKASYDIAKIMIPMSLAVTLLKYLGVIEVLSELISPFSNLLGLQGDSILALLSGYFINTYSAIAVMATLSLTMKEIIIISSMLLLCHTLPVELGIQKKAGGPAF